jgi:hypothetical protein
MEKITNKQLQCISCKLRKAEMFYLLLVPPWLCNSLHARMECHGRPLRFLVRFFGFLCSVLYIVVCPSVHFVLTIVLSVPFSIDDHDYPFGSFKLF